MRVARSTFLVSQKQKSDNPKHKLMKIDTLLDNDLAVRGDLIYSVRLARWLLVQGQPETQFELFSL